MVRVEDECVGCPKGMGCLGSACPNRNVKYFSCDLCDEDYDEDELVQYDGMDLCKDCLFGQFPKISY